MRVNPYAGRTRKISPQILCGVGQMQDGSMQDGSVRIVTPTKNTTKHTSITKIHKQQIIILKTNKKVYFQSNLKWYN